MKDMFCRSCSGGHVGLGGAGRADFAGVRAGAAVPGGAARRDAGRPERAAVAAIEAEPRAGHFVIRGAEVVGVGVVDVEVKDGRIAAIGAVAAGPLELRGAGRWIAPAAIDSHVHLSYLPGGPPHARRRGGGGGRPGGAC